MRKASWLIGLSLLSSAGLAADKTIEPGFYEIVTKSDAGTNTTRKCLTSNDIVAGLNPDLGKTCKSLRSVAAGGKFDFATACPDVTLTMTGTYTPTGYAIDGKLTPKRGGDPPLETHITAKRIAENCPN